MREVKRKAAKAEYSLMKHDLEERINNPHLANNFPVQLMFQEILCNDQKGTYFRMWNYFPLNQRKQSNAKIQGGGKLKMQKTWEVIKD